MGGYVGTVILQDDSLQLQRPLSLLLQAPRLQENTKTISYLLVHENSLSNTFVREFIIVSKAWMSEEMVIPFMYVKLKVFNHHLKEEKDFSRY